MKNTTKQKKLQNTDRKKTKESNRNQQNRKKAKQMNQQTDVTDTSKGEIKQINKYLRRNNNIKSL